MTWKVVGEEGLGSAGQLWAYLQQEEGFPARCPLSLASAYVTIGRVTDRWVGWGGGNPTLNPYQARLERVS